jgi:iron complex transport system substrate-binding protein
MCWGLSSNSEEGKARRRLRRNRRNVMSYAARMVTRPERIIIPAEIEEMATIAVNATFEVHCTYGAGLLESAYEACFVRELDLRGVNYHRQVPVPLNYKGKPIEAGFRGDMVIEGKLLIELKALEQILPVHKAQVITYLKLLNLPLGLMINFNEALIKDGVQRILNISKHKQTV